MPTEKEEKKPYQQSCTWIMALIVILLVALGYFAIYRDKKVGRRSMSGGKWVARGGCACQLPN